MWGALADDPPPSPARTREGVLDALAHLEHLVVPASVTRSGRGLGFAGRREYLSDLLARDPAVFLERHGCHLVDADLSAFDHLRGDYEIDLHLARVAARLTPSAAQTAAGRGRARNRRLAHVSSLEADGYFAEDAMRRRDPLLYETVVGDPPRRLVVEADEDPSADLADGKRAHVAAMSLLAAEDDRAVAAELATRRDAARRDADDASSGESSEGDEDDARPDGPSRAARLEAFRRAMVERVLDGADECVDYRRVDADASLDAKWDREESLDAEEAYFADA